MGIFPKDKSRSTKADNSPIKSINGGYMTIQNDTSKIDHCFFYKIGYLWFFDGNYLILKSNNNLILKKYRIHFGDLTYNPNDFTLVDFDTGRFIPGNWHISTKSIGVNRSNDLIISVPEMWFDITGEGRRYTRAVNQSFILNFVR